MIASPKKYKSPQTRHVVVVVVAIRGVCLEHRHQLARERADDAVADLAWARVWAPVTGQNIIWVSDEYGAIAQTYGRFTWRPSSETIG